MKRITRKILLSIGLVWLWLILGFSRADAAVLFEDNFDNYEEGTLPSKWIPYNSPDEHPCAAQWKAFAGTLNIQITSPGCSSHIIPSPSSMPTMLSEYIFEVDIRYNGGTDRHISYRLNPSSHSIRTLHFFAPTDFGADSDNSNITYHLSRNYLYNHTYRFKIVVTNNTLKVYSGEPNGILELVHEVSHIEPLEPGIIGLGSSPGGAAAETWFDNVRVTTLDHVDTQPEPGLPITLLKQTDPAWGNDIYDSASLWSPSATGVSRWGCAMTSATMVFQYNGLTKMLDGSDLTPGTVNQWLKSQSDGYVRNGLLNWISLSRLSKQISDFNGVTYDALEYEGRNPDNAFLTNILDNSIPAILSVPGHFIVAKGVDSANSTFWINDPFYAITSLSDPLYNNTYTKMGTYTQSNTDLSYIMLVVNPNVNIELLDPPGDPVGESTIENPIDDAQGDAVNSNGAVRVFYLKKPVNGEYELNLSSTTSGPYTLDQYFYDVNGEVKKISVNGNISAGNSEIYTLNYSKQNSSQSTSTKQILVTFDSIKAKIVSGYKTKKIKDTLTYLALLTELELAKRARTTGIKKGLLDLMILTISRDKRIDKTFGLELIGDIRILKSSL